MIKLNKKMFLLGFRSVKRFAATYTDKVITFDLKVKFKLFVFYYMFPNMKQTVYIKI